MIAAFIFVFFIFVLNLSSTLIRKNIYERAFTENGDLLKFMKENYEKDVKNMDEIRFKLAANGSLSDEDKAEMKRLQNRVDIYYKIRNGMSS